MPTVTEAWRMRYEATHAHGAEGLGIAAAAEAAGR
jgi:hypothetical protein